MRVALVAGEASGDLLGAGLVRELKRLVPDAEILGIAGPEMERAGCRTLYPSEALAVMGLVEILRHLPRILRIRRELRRTLLENPPDVFIGIDAPEFNLPLERQLRRRGIKTVHYVSPTVWAWRQGRIRGIGRSVDCMLTLFPFEVDVYREHGVGVEWVGHPLADMIPLQVDRDAARRALELEPAAEVVALLPGSRSGEIERLGPDFLRAAALCLERRPGLRFVAPMAGGALAARFAELQHQYAPGLPVEILEGRSREAMAAADVALLASGTASLEAMLLKRPMVVGYRVSALTYRLLTRLKLLKIDRFALPNLLTGDDAVPELIQDQMTPENLAEAVLLWLQNPDQAQRLRERFARVHERLRRDASRRAAEAVLRLVGARQPGRPDA